jgi:phosphodiesterase/alkaline phosphatase D-like protein
MVDELTRRDALRAGAGALGAALLTSCSDSPPPSASGRVRRPWVGAVSTTGATVAVKVANASRARLRIARDNALTVDLTYSTRRLLDDSGAAKLVARDLRPATQYYYGVEVDGSLHRGKMGSFRTRPADPRSFTFAFGSCCSRVTADVFSEIRAHDPDFLVHLGDLHYENIDTDDVDAFASGFDRALASAHQGPLFANVPTVYTWSDHDFGANNSDRTSASRAAAQAAYRLYVPSYRLPSTTGGIYHSFAYGRVRFIVTDNRSYRSPHSVSDTAHKTVLGPEQKAWFKETVSSTGEPVIVWANETPWVAPARTGEDDWGGYSTERSELAAHIQASGKNLVIISGDMHALAADDGSNSPGRIPVFHAASFSGWSSHKGGPYTHGPYPAVEGERLQQYGLMRVRDTDRHITLEYTGYERGGTSRLTYTRSFRTPRA